MFYSVYKKSQLPKKTEEVIQKKMIKTSKKKSHVQFIHLSLIEHVYNRAPPVSICQNTPKLDDYTGC